MGDCNWEAGKGAQGNAGDNVGSSSGDPHGPWIAQSLSLVCLPLADQLPAIWAGLILGAIIHGDGAPVLLNHLCYLNKSHSHSSLGSLPFLGWKLPAIIKLPTSQHHRCPVPPHFSTRKTQTFSLFQPPKSCPIHCQLCGFSLSVSKPLCLSFLTLHKCTLTCLSPFHGPRNS